MSNQQPQATTPSHAPQVTTQLTGAPAPIPHAHHPPPPQGYPYVYGYAAAPPPAAHMVGMHPPPGAIMAPQAMPMVARMGSNTASQGQGTQLQGMVAPQAMYYHYVQPNYLVPIQTQQQMTQQHAPPHTPQTPQQNQTQAQTQVQVIQQTPTQSTATNQTQRAASVDSSSNQTHQACFLAFIFI